MPSGIAEVLAKCMEPVDEYEKVLGILRAFTGHDPGKIRQDLFAKCREALGGMDVDMHTDHSTERRTLFWGESNDPNRYLFIQAHIVDIEWIMRHNYDRVRAMAGRNNDRRILINNVDQPELIQVDVMLKQYVELSYKLSVVFEFGTKLFWDKTAIQSE